MLAANASGVYRDGLVVFLLRQMAHAAVGTHHSSSWSKPARQAAVEVARGLLLDALNVDMVVLLHSRALLLVRLLDERAGLAPRDLRDVIGTLALASGALRNLHRLASGATSSLSDDSVGGITSLCRRWLILECFVGLQSTSMVASIGIVVSKAARVVRDLAARGLVDSRFGTLVQRAARN
jgi:hypothetical protein